MKVGIYICHCGVNIAATVDIEKVTAFACALPRVAVVRNYPYVCSDPGQDFIKKDIKQGASTAWSWLPALLECMNLPIDELSNRSD